MAPVVPLGIVEIRRNRHESGVTWRRVEGDALASDAMGKEVATLLGWNFSRAFPSFTPSGLPTVTPSMH